MKYKTIMRKLRENGWNMKFDARENALIEDNIGTIRAEGFIIYDDEPETEYQILNSKYLVKI